MIHHEPWYKEAASFEEQLSRILTKVMHEGDSALPELDAFLRRTDFWETQIISRAEDEVIPEDNLSGGYEPLYQQDPAHPGVDWTELDSDRGPTEVLSTKFSPGTWTFDVEGATSHTVSVTVGEDLEDYARLDDPLRPFGDAHLALPTLKREWKEIAEKIALGETHDPHWKSPGYARTDFEGVEVISFSRDPDMGRDRVIEGPNYDEWFPLDWILTFKVKWNAMVPVDEVLSGW